MTAGMRIGIVSDEISPDVHVAIETGVSWGIRDFELRMVGEHRIPFISSTQLKQLLQLQSEKSIRFTALSPGVFKGSLNDESAIRNQLNQVLPQTFQIAGKLSISTVIVFGFLRGNMDSDEEAEKVVSILRQAGDLARPYGITIAVENEPGTWCHSGSQTAEILQKVALENVKANWDPANAIGTVELPYPTGYEWIKKWIANVHLKDTVKGALVECVPLGTGVVDWPGQIKALLQDQPVEHLTIETHCTPLMEKSKQNLDQLRKWLREFSHI